MHYRNNTVCPNIGAMKVSDLARKLDAETLVNAKRVVASGEFDMSKLEIVEPSTSDE